MALLIMAVYDTDDNGRSEYTERTLESLRNTVDWSRHRLVVVDNGSCEKSKLLIRNCGIDGINVITNHENVGTACAVNMGLKMREPCEYCIKMDNDVVVHAGGWVDEMEQAIEREPKIGVLGLKRKDLRQTPYDADADFRSELVQLPHTAGERWITVEKSRDIMGTCTMLNWRLVDRIGGYRQAGVYGFDDTLYNLRSILAGFWNAFLPHIEIDHIDTGDNTYTVEKHRLASEAWEQYHVMHRQYVNSERGLFEGYD